MNIGEIASKQAVTAPLSASLQEVCEMMLQCGVGAVVVTESVDGHARVAGIITDRDIVRARLGRSSALSALLVADVMTRTPLVLDAEDSVANAIRHLQARGVRRAPVIDRDGRLLGLVSTDDLLGEVAAELSGLAQIVAKQGHLRQT